MPDAEQVSSQVIDPNLGEKIAETKQSLDDGGSANWRNRIPEDVKGEKFWDTFKTEADAFKAHAELVKYRGANPKIPGPDAKPEEIQAFRKRIGVPDLADGYQIKRPETIPEGMGYDEELEKGFLSKVAHAEGFTPKQAQAVVDYWNNEVAPKMFAFPSATEVETGLKEAWGADFQKHSHSRDRYVRAYLDQETADAFDRLPLKEQIKINSHFAQRGMALKEGSSIDIDQKGSIEPDRSALEREKAKFFTPGTDEYKAYTDRSHPLHKSMIERKREIDQRLSQG